jgi:hypothetical protein
VTKAATKFWSIFALCTVCVCGSTDTSAGSMSLRHVPVVVYDRGDKEDAISCSHGDGRDYCMSKDSIGFSFSDCSDDKYNCVFDRFNVFAVPKQSLKKGLTFEVFGATLTVERCFGDSETCDLAMISSVCANDAVCSCRLIGTERSRSVFYFSSRYGITTFFTAIVESDTQVPRVAAEEIRDEIPLRTYVLAGESGFLREHWNLKTAKLMSECPK